MVLSFPLRPSPPRPTKRCRAITDIDGEQCCLERKKRRLRLFLITSRLSPEFSLPASNIVDRGNSKIAVWAKQKALGRNLLRKAAILNCIRRRATAARDLEEERLRRSPAEQEKEEKQLELAKLALVYGSHDTHTRPIFRRTASFPPTIAMKVSKEPEKSKPTNFEPSSPNFPPKSATTDANAEESSYRSPNDAYSYPPPKAQIPRRTHSPLPPSPLGLSNYAAFDDENDFPDPYSHYDEDENEPHQSDSSEADMHEADADQRRSSSASTTASYASTLSATAPETPPQSIYSDFNITLDAGDSVLGDCDRIDEGFWPNTLEALTQVTAITALPVETPTTGAAEGQTTSGSCSPNFAILLATDDARGKNANFLHLDS